MAARAKNAKKGEDEVRAADGRFLPGKTINPSGRPKGAINKTTRDMKAMMATALEIAGGQSLDVLKEMDPEMVEKYDLEGVDPGVVYLSTQAHKNPVAFLGLLKQLIPQKVDVDMLIASERMIETLQKRRNQLAELRDITPEETEDDG